MLPDCAVMYFANSMVEAVASDQSQYTLQSLSNTGAMLRSPTPLIESVPLLLSPFLSISTYSVSLLKKELRQIGSILSSDTSDKCYLAFFSHITMYIIGCLLFDKLWCVDSWIRCPDKALQKETEEYLLIPTTVSTREKKVTRRVIFEFFKNERKIFTNSKWQNCEFDRWR